MSQGTYRNDLDAAQRRSAALELDLASAQLRIQELEGASTGKKCDTSLQRLLNAGALEEKLAQNRKIRREAKERAAEERSRDRQRRWDRWSARRRRRRSMCFYPMFSRLTLSLAVIGMAVPFTALFIIFHSARVFLAYLMAAIFIAYLPSVAWAWWAAHRERARVGDLPFKVSGHIETLGKDTKAPTLTITFEGETPTEIEARALLLGLARDTRNPFTALSLRETEVKAVNNSITFSSPSMETSWHTDNRSYLLWYRRLVEAGAATLHQTYPVTSVRIQ